MSNPIRILILFLYGGCIGLLQSCGELPAKKVEYIHKKGDQSIEVRIRTGNDYLTYDTPTAIDFEWTNIDPNSVIIGGTGIKLLGILDATTQTEFTVTREQLKTDTLRITVLYKSGDKRIPAAFHIPVKSGK